MKTQKRKRKEVSTSKYFNSLITKIIPFNISLLLFFIVFLFVCFLLFYILLTHGEGTVVTRCIRLFSWVHNGLFSVTVMPAMVRPVPKDEPSSYIFQII